MVIHTVKPQLKATFWMTAYLKSGLKLGDSPTKLDDAKIFLFLEQGTESGLGILYTGTGILFFGPSAKQETGQDKKHMNRSCFTGFTGFAGL